MGWVTSKGNEAKLQRKHLSDMFMPRFELGGNDLWSNMLPITIRPQRCPGSLGQLDWNTGWSSSPNHAGIIIIYKIYIAPYITCKKVTLKVLYNNM